MNMKITVSMLLIASLAVVQTAEAKKHKWMKSLLTNEPQETAKIEAPKESPAKIEETESAEVKAEEPAEAKVEEPAEETAEVQKMGMSQLQQLLKKNKKLLVIDVRSSGEFATGHIKGAVNIPVNVIENRISSVASDKNKAVYLYCKSGMRSGSAGEKLVSIGYKKVYNCGSVNDWPGKLETR